MSESQSACEKALISVTPALDSPSVCKLRAKSCFICDEAAVLIRTETVTMIYVALVITHRLRVDLEPIVSHSADD